MPRYIETDLSQFPWCPPDKKEELSRYIQRVDDDGTVYNIPCDPDNYDFRVYEQWLADGNIPEEGDFSAA